MNLALEDFFEEGSSIGYPSHLPINVLQLNNPLIKNERFIKASIQFANAMGFEVVANGISTKKQKDFLILQGCTIGQGPCFSKPIDTHEMEKYIKESIKTYKRHLKK